jgi:hypothetical protein
VGVRGFVMNEYSRTVCTGWSCPTST